MASSTGPTNTPPPHDPSAHNAKATETQNVNQATVNVTSNDVNFMATIFMALLSSVNTVSDLAQTQAIKIQINSKMQMNTNQSISHLQNLVVPNNATTTQLKQIEQINANITVYRQGVQGGVMGMRQTGQQLMQVAQTYVSYMQQGGSATTLVLKTMITVMKLINKISPGAS